MILAQRSLVHLLFLVLLLPLVRPARLVPLRREKKQRLTSSVPQPKSTVYGRGLMLRLITVVVRLTSFALRPHHRWFSCVTPLALPALLSRLQLPVHLVTYRTQREPQPEQHLNRLVPAPQAEILRPRLSMFLLRLHTSPDVPFSFCAHRVALLLPRHLTSGGARGLRQPVGRRVLSLVLLATTHLDLITKRFPDEFGVW